MRNLIEGSDLPRPSYNHRVLDEGRLVAEIDVAYPGLKLGFEIDGFAYHSSVTAVEHDATRDAALRRRGWTVPRIPASLLERSPASVLRMMRDELSAAASRS
jgi:very-short-patch-repair endonuclease